MPTNFRPQIWFQVIISVIGSCSQNEIRTPAPWYTCERITTDGSLGYKYLKSEIMTWNGARGTPRAPRRGWSGKNYGGQNTNFRPQMWLCGFKSLSQLFPSWGTLVSQLLGGDVECSRDLSDSSHSLLSLTRLTQLWLRVRNSERSTSPLLKKHN